MALVQSKQLFRPISGSFTGSFSGDGSNLINLPGGNKIISGSATASISPTDGFVVNISTLITGSLTASGSTFLQGTLFITGSNESTLLLVKNYQDEPVFEVKQTGVVSFATQSSELSDASASAGSIYFTSSSFFVGLE